MSVCGHGFDHATSECITYRLQYTPEAAEDLLLLYEFLVDTHVALTGRAITVIESALDVMCLHPYVCRKAQGDDLGSQWRELLINFRSGGYIALFQILDDETVQVAAVRHRGKAITTKPATQAFGKVTPTCP